LTQVVFEVVDPSKPKRFFEVVETLLQAKANLKLVMLEAKQMLKL
jgi:hypothetical protein